MSQALFPGFDHADRAEMQRALSRPDGAVFVIERDAHSLGGYVEVGARSVSDGCDTSPVGYIEAWYVDPDLRRKGLGKLLLDAAESWSASRGYQEMGSDALVENEVSHAAHKAAGYEEVCRTVVFRKTIRGPVKSSNVKEAIPFYWVENIERSLAFYVDGLGFVTTREWIDGGKLKWCSLDLGDASVMLQEISADPEHRRRFDSKKGVGVAMNFICVDAIALYRELKSRGIDASRPFVGNGMWVTQVTDPDGYELYFESPTDAAEEKELEE